MSNVHDLLKSLVDNGVFGSVKYVSSKAENDVDKGTQFASLIDFFILTLNDGFKNMDYHIVIKKIHASEESRNLFNSDVAFKNETIMYTKIIPLLKANELNLFPKLYEAVATNGEHEDVLIFENLQQLGYNVTKEKIFLDYDHIEMGLKKLGQFHGLSYLAKQNNKEKFFNIAKNLIETKFTTGEIEERKTFLYVSMLRGINHLVEKNIQTDTLNKLINKLKNVIKVADDLLKPEEPFSVICHGDFCRNNMFYKYNENNIPIDIKFFDLQNSLYTSPAIDLSFFLYMNTTAELREKYWDKFLEIYWSSITDSVPNIGFTYQQFLEHFAKRALYGYFPTSFFLPISMEDETNKFQIDEFSNKTMDEKANIFLNCSGEEGTLAISDIVLHLLNKKYIEEFLEL